MANANAAGFDDSAYLTRGAALTGIANSKLFAAAIWLKKDSVNAIDSILHAVGNDFLFQWQADNTLQIEGEDSGGADCLNISAAADTRTTWFCVLVSCDMADTGKRHVYYNHTDSIGTVNTYTDNAIRFATPTEWGIGAAGTGARTFDGDLGPVWFNDGQYIDFSIEANRKIFVTTDNLCPQSLANSTDGDVGGLGQPLIFLNSTLATYQNNLGTGGGFTENNTLAATTGPEIAASTAAILRRRRQLVGFNN